MLKKTFLFIAGDDLDNFLKHFLTQTEFGKARVATEVRTSPANVSYDTQGALNELPLDISNVMNGFDGDVKWWALHPN
ncbi:hypothetical protein DSO57_1010694 [Entomophthora muscae]|uniref:Uncharacterized protein n=1 Tax=Entomophthora muscae TaxID=34485 RepID=A0ACC2SJ94_9FUNG|nr:hypothetical protein DSO57_1010694 [Entomophthora muscae]